MNSDTHKRRGVRQIGGTLLWLFAALNFAIPAAGAAVIAAPPGGLHVGAAAAEFEADDTMIIAGGITPGKAKGQEGSFARSLWCWSRSLSANSRSSRATC